jgi:hypothetical protein
MAQAHPVDDADDLGRLQGIERLRVRDREPVLVAQVRAERKHGVSEVAAHARFARTEPSP